MQLYPFRGTKNTGSRTRADERSKKRAEEAKRRQERNRKRMAETGNAPTRKSSRGRVKPMTRSTTESLRKSRARRKREEEAKTKPTAAMLAIPPKGNPSMTPAATATAKRSDVKKAREAMSGPSARLRLPNPKNPPKAPKSDLKSSGTTTAPKGDIRTPTASIVGEKSTGASGARDNPKSVLGGQKRAERQGKKEGTGTFIGKDGRKKAAVTKEDLEKSGLSLRDYLNKQKGLTRRKDMKDGGSVKKTTKAKKTSKVRGSGIAIRGVRPAKMR